MDRTIILHLVLLGMVGPLHAQEHDTPLRAELERIHFLDQNDRQNVSGYIGTEKDSVVAHMILQDSMNLVRVLAIIDSAGWLGPEQVGARASQALFLVLQHGDTRPDIQEAYLPVMRDAVAEGKARASEFAMFEDRVAVNHGRPQIYGSQIGWKDGKAFIRPIADEAHVNERRAAVGLEPLEKYAERFDLHWSPPVEKERVLLMGPLEH